MRRARPVLAALVALACGGAAKAPSAEARPRPPASRAAPASTRLDARSAERVGLRWEAAVGGYGLAVAVHGSLSKVFVATEQSTAAYHHGTGERIADLPACSGVLRSGLAIEGGTLVVACERGLRRFDAASLERVDVVESAEPRATAAAFAPGHVALGHRDGVVRIYSLSGGPTREIPVPGPPIDVKSLALSPDASIVAVAWVQGSVWWWRLSEPDVHHALVRHERESDALAFDSTGTLLAEEGEAEHTALWRLDAPSAPRARIKNGDWVKRILFSADDAWLVRGGSDGLELAEIDGPRRVALDTTGMVEDASLDEQKSTIAAIDRKGRLTLWAPR